MQASPNESMLWQFVATLLLFKAFRKKINKSILVLAFISVQHLSTVSFDAKYVCQQVK